MSSSSKQLSHARTFAKLMDSQFRILGIPVGLDTLISLVPGLGDALGFALSMYLLLIAWRMGCPRSLLGQMVGNLMIDAAIGSVPLLGDVFDLFFKANLRNLAILENWAAKQ